MGNTANSQQNPSENDRLSTESLNGSGCKEKLGGSGWKFSTLNDGDEIDCINENENLLNEYDDDDNESEDEKDGNYSTNFKNITNKDLNLNSILLIDDQDDVDLLQFTHQQHQNLSSSSATISTPPTSASSSPLIKDDKTNDTVDNLAFNLLQRLTLARDEIATSADLGESEIEEPIPPPPCTPVSSLIAALSEPLASYKHIYEKLLGNVNNSPNSPTNKPQLIIDDVLLMSREDGTRPVVPLAEQELSFTATDQSKDDGEIKQVPQSSIETVVTPAAVAHDTEREVTPEKKTEFMRLINKIVPHSNLVEYCFEYEASSGDERDVKLTGSFNNWEQYLPMSRDSSNKNKWFKSLMLAPGNYEYKFVINNIDWKINGTKLNNGNNNVLTLIKI